ncbi:uncharacterized protein LOC142173445 [Nicotiana tabacum]|uniref:Uncharacterized protein LOC142173445 n=1 Tax=Nicotiana tabacum TaxID=4097 RepID=A0AC58TD48_TOBAC
MTEYEAYILGIRMTIDMNIEELLVIGDSDMLIHQVQGEWSAKNVKILPYLHCMKELCEKFTKIEFKHVPRIQNEFADAFATLSSMIQHADKSYIDPIEEAGKPLFPQRGSPVQEDPELGLLRCVDVTVATRLLEEMHAGTCGSHMNGFTLAKNILRAG